MKEGRTHRLRGLIRSNRRRRAREEVIPQLSAVLLGGFSPDHLHEIDESGGIIETYWASYRAVENDTTKCFSAKWGVEDRKGITEFFQRFRSRVPDSRVKLLLSRREAGVLDIDFARLLTVPIEVALIDSESLKVFRPHDKSGLLFSKETSHYGHDNLIQEWTLEIWGSVWLAAATENLEKPN